MFFSFTFANQYWFFYGQGCGHCAKAMQYLDAEGYTEKYNITWKEMYFDQENRDLFLVLQEKL